MKNPYTTFKKELENQGAQLLSIKPDYDEFGQKYKQRLKVWYKIYGQTKSKIIFKNKLENINDLVKRFIKQ